MFNSYSSESLATILKCAQLEIIDSVRSIRNDPNPYTDSGIVDLCTALSERFSSISKHFYGVDDSALPSKQQLIYSYPIIYLDMVFRQSQDSCMKILPYLLAAYYVNYPLNRIVYAKHKPDDDSLSAEDMLFDYEDTPTGGLPPNYNADLDSFCNHFSVEHMIDHFLEKRRTGYSRDIQRLKNRSALIAFLNNGIQSQKADFQLSSLHFEKTLQAYIYSVCASCCARISELSAKIDYALSAELFNEHTLAFESLHTRNTGFCLKDWFSHEALSDTLDCFYAEQLLTDDISDNSDELTLETLKSIHTENCSDGCSLSGTINDTLGKDPLTIPPDAGFHMSDLRLEPNFSESDLARNIALLFSVIFDSENYPWFRNKEIMEHCLTHQNLAPFERDDDI